MLVAYRAVTATFGASLPEGGVTLDSGSAPDPVAAKAALDVLVAAAQGAHKTSFEAALAVLVADGASPTQAHVTTANNAYTTLKGDIDAIVTTGIVISADLTLMFDPAKVVTRTHLARALERLLRVVEGSDTLTA
jgi:hypothetical protein